MPTPHPGKWKILLDDSIEPKPVDSQVTAIHAHLVPILIDLEELHPKAMILYWHGRYLSNNVLGEGEVPPIIVTCLFDPNTNEITQYGIFRWSDTAADPSEVFCSGHTFLANGNLITAGGERNQPPFNIAGAGGTKYSFLFDSSVFSDLDPRPIPWKNASEDPMSKGRWYPQLTKLFDGNVIAVSGYNYDRTGVEDVHEIYNPNSQTWSEITGIGADMEVPLYNGAYLLPFGDWVGQVFYDLVAWGPWLEYWEGAHRFNPYADDNEFWYEIGEQAYAKIRYHGSSVALPIKSTDTNIRIINLGGVGYLEELDYTKTCEMISLGDSSTPDWIGTKDLNYMRHDCPGALLLADASLIVIGGGNATDTTLETEVFDYSDPDPSQWSWSEIIFAEGESMHVPRKYHSTAFLIPDGRVWVGGSRIYTDPQRAEFENDMERRIEFFSPGYLFEGPRPLITSAPLVINYDEVFSVAYDVTSEIIPTINSIVLISLPSVTHCFDSNQRYLVLDFEQSLTYGVLDATAPLNRYIAPPGYYMLFLLQDKLQSDSGEVRIPSIAKIIKLEVA